MAVVTPTAKAQFIDAAGIPLAGGFLYTYQAGTTIPQATYTDSTGSVANTNPIELDARGEANIWLGSATYKFKLADSNNTEIWTVDNVSAPTTALSPVLSGNVTIDSDTAGPALKITQTGGGPVMRVQDSADPDSTPFIIDNVGQVGIGTATPANALDIAGGTVQISSSGGTSYTTISADATDSIIAVTSDRNLTIKTNAATRLTVNSSGSTFTGSVTATSFTGAWANIPAGTAMLFAQTTAPTGWTKSTTHDNKALRVVSGAASSGGSVAFTTAFASQAVTGTVASYTLTTADIPAHSHSATSTSTVSDPQHTHGPGGTGASFLQATTGTTYSLLGSGGLTAYVSAATAAAATGISVSTSTSIGNTGGGGGHAHGFSAPNINLAVQYVDVIIATKD